jgi:hypothetical protein
VTPQTPEVERTGIDSQNAQGLVPKIADYEAGVEVKEVDKCDGQVN